ncbi:MAG: glycosyltransferase family 2 protein [Pseudomonadota bacterium]
MTSQVATHAISCIICAFNEAPRIAAVLAIVSSHPLLKEIIVVDDGSTDATAEVVRGFSSVKLIVLPVNQGKSTAMAAGLAAASNSWVMLLDADLVGLLPEDISALAAPVLAGQATISLSLRQNSLWFFRLMGMDFVTGERVIPHDLLSGQLATMKRLPGFGIEVFMNRQIIARKLQIAVIDWAGVSQSRKTEKMGYAKGIWAEFRMVAHLLRTATPVTLLGQMLRMLFLRKRRGDQTKADRLRLGSGPKPL